jgi:radical SAM superfamily enzyme YgiQ (UPF0313 family)
MPSCGRKVEPERQRITHAMTPILLATLNAQYIHASLGLRYLLANLGELWAEAQLLEFTVEQRPIDIVESLLAHNPAIIGLGVYIWNVAQTTEVVALLKTVRPEVVVILGGPEVSFECDEQRIVQLADYVITGRESDSRARARDGRPGASVSGVHR